MLTLNDYIAELQKLAESHGDKEVILLDEFTGRSRNEVDISSPKVFKEYSVGGQEGYFVEKDNSLENLIGSRQMQYANPNALREVVVLNINDDY